jgi:hypothetical protein
MQYQRSGGDADSKQHRRALKLPAPCRVSDQIGGIRHFERTGVRSWQERQRIAPMSNINKGKPWSTLDLQNLRDGLRAGMPILQLAKFLARNAQEVEMKIAELTANHSAEQETPGIK